MIISKVVLKWKLSEIMNDEILNFGDNNSAGFSSLYSQNHVLEMVKSWSYL